MKMNTFHAHLVSLMGVEMSDVTELVRALKETMPDFDADAAVGHGVRQVAEDGAIAFDANLLRGRPGPGGGLEVDPFRAAFLLLAIIVNGPRRESAVATWVTWHLPTAGSEMSGYGDDFKPTMLVCPLTGEFLFGAAMKRIVADEDLAARVCSVRVVPGLSAEIAFDDGNVSRFERPHGRTPRLRRAAEVDGIVLHAIAQILKREG